MRVVLTFDETDPPVGRLGDTLAFSGWLGLLSVLSDVLAAGGRAPQPLSARADAHLEERVAPVGVDGSGRDE